MFSKRIMTVACALVVCLALAGQAQDPNEASAPSPADGAQWIKTEGITLTWTVGVDAILRNIYFGTDQAAVEARDASTQLRMMSLATEIELDALETATTYYWAVDEWSSAGITYPGPVWSFTTFDPEDGGAVAEYWSNMNLDGAPDVVTTVSEINYDWGSADVPGENSPDAAIPVDGFSCRWSAELTVPTTGTYTLYQASAAQPKMPPSHWNWWPAKRIWWLWKCTRTVAAPPRTCVGKALASPSRLFRKALCRFRRWPSRPHLPLARRPWRAHRP
jgi:hypothetical protein